MCFLYIFWGVGGLGGALYIRRAVLAQLCRRVGSQCKIYIVQAHVQLLVQVPFAEACFSKFASDFSHLLRGLQKHAFSETVVLLSKTSTFRSKCR